MSQLILFFKGFIIGIGKIIPGVSGCVLAVLMGVYEQALDYLVNFNKKMKESLSFLGPLALGIFLAIMLFSKIILYFWENYNLSTMCFFFGLLVGSIPSLKKKVKLEFKDYLFIFFLIFIMFVLSSNIELSNFAINSNWSYLWIVFLGMIDALSMIIPGLSGTALYLMLGSYNFILSLFSNPFKNILASLSFLIGFIFSFLLLAKLLNYLFKKNYHFTWVMIMAFILFSLITFFGQIPLMFNVSLIIEAIIFIILGIFLALLTPLE